MVNDLKKKVYISLNDVEQIVSLDDLFLIPFGIFDTDSSELFISSRLLMAVAKLLVDGSDDK